MVSILPWDVDRVCESVSRTGRCVVAHEAPKTSGFGAEVAATIQVREEAERAFLSYYLCGIKSGILILGNVSRWPIRTLQPAFFSLVSFGNIFASQSTIETKCGAIFSVLHFFESLAYYSPQIVAIARPISLFLFLPGIPLLCPPSLPQGSEGEIRWPFPSSFPPRFQKGGGEIRRPAGCYDAVVGMSLFRPNQDLFLDYVLCSPCITCFFPHKRSNFFCFITLRPTMLQRRCFTENDYASFF